MTKCHNNNLVAQYIKYWQTAQLLNVFWSFFQRFSDAVTRSGDYSDDIQFTSCIWSVIMQHVGCFFQIKEHQRQSATLSVLFRPFTWV